MLTLQLLTLRYHAWFHGIRSIRKRNLPRRKFTMALDAWVDIHPTIPRYDTSLLLPRKSPMVRRHKPKTVIVQTSDLAQVHGERKIRQGLPCHEAAPHE